jgi:cell division septal protein FtsQ
MQKLIQRIVLLCIAILLALQGWQFFVNIPWWKLSDVQLKGDLYWPRESLLGKLNIPDGKSIFLVDTGTLKKEMERLPQVRAVKVYRRLPSTIVIDIEERCPWAKAVINGETIIIDKEGKILNVTGVQVLATDKQLDLRGLSSIRDLEPFAKKFKTSLEKIQSIFPEQAVQVDAIGPYEINVKINKQLPIMWGMEDNIDEKARLLRAVLPVISGQWARVGYIDVRSPKNMAIRYL